MTTSTNAAPGISKPSFQDYTCFHRMVCSPSQARRCVNSFNGVILFADCTLYNQDEVSENDLSMVDYSRSVIPWSVATYYLLVVFSLSGICSLLGCTTMTHQKEDQRFTTNKNTAQGHCHRHPTIRSEFHEELRVPPVVIDYLLKRSATEFSTVKSSEFPVELQLTQRLDFEFGFLYKVMMLHFECSNGRKHLLEIYKFHSPLLGAVVNTMIDSIRQILHWLQPIDKAKED